MHLKSTLETTTFSASALALYDLPCWKTYLPWPCVMAKKWYSPGIMGPFSFAPFMECYHGIVSMGHRIEGNLHYEHHNISFTDGKGWHWEGLGPIIFHQPMYGCSPIIFENDAFRFKLSVARIPWLTGDFRLYCRLLWWRKINPVHYIQWL